MPDLFVSHVQEDRVDGTELARALEQAGYGVWFYERDSLPGPAYIDQIVQAIENIKVMILLISRRALKSDQMDREVVRAFQRGKGILPVLKDLSFEEFQELKPSWDHILGASGALEVSGGGILAVLPRLMSGLTALGLAPPLDQMDEEGRRLAERTRGTATPSGVSISELAQQLSLSGPMLMRKARDVFGRDIRTPSHVLTADQAEELRARFGAGTLTDKPATGALPLPPIRLDLGEGVFLDLVGIPPGRFTMGSPLNEEGHNNDEVEHNVKISRPFYLGRHLISQAQYEQAMKSNPSYFKDPALPVETVSWFDAVSFCEELFTRFGKPFRLPTEAEWEYACRAGTTTPFNTGATMNTDQANFDGKFTFGGSLESLSRWRTTPVGSFSPNSWGLYDMHGNVWEWCSDWYGEYTQTPVTDPQGPPVGAIRILRGGSWFHGPADCRSAQREALDPGRRHSPYGFRVAMGSV